MKSLIAATLISIFAFGFSDNASAEPGGCLKYGAGGALAGHFVGQGHAVLGGAAGCAAGAWKRHQYRKHQNTGSYGNSYGHGYHSGY